MAKDSTKSSLHTDLRQACTEGEFPNLQELYHALNETEREQLLNQIQIPSDEIRDTLLVQAVQHEEPSILRFILNSPSSAEIPEEAIGRALLSSSTELYSILFSSDPSIIHRSILDGRETQIGKALCMRTTPARLEAFLAFGLRPSNEPFDLSPLMLACSPWQTESQQLCTILLRNGASLVHSGALASAAESGRLELVSWLLDQGADVNDVITNSGLIDHPCKGHPWPALHAAIEHGHADVVRLLLARGADPKLLDQQGRTAHKVAKAVGRESLLS